MNTSFPNTPQHFLLPGPAGDLELMTTWPKTAAPNAVGIICHPDPQQQGTMNNKVVTMIAKAFDHLGLATVRFNFRGVGESQGEYGHTVGEADDLMAVLTWVKTTLPSTTIWLAGFSFGSYIAAKVADQIPKEITQLVSVAPPVNHRDFTPLTHIQCPWLVIQGDQDEVVPVSEVQSFAKQPPSPLELVIMQGVSHFFHGRLIELRDKLEEKLLKSEASND